MDMTEAFRSEDISKTDFFDFVVAPDATENQQAINFNRTLKSMGIFIDAPHNNNGVSNEFLECKIEEEQNNNHLMLSGNDHGESIGLNSVVGNFVDHPFWATTCDKETVRIESAILEDLNKFCWTQESDIVLNNNNNNINNNHSPSSQCHKDGGSLNGGNTDGAIYTLTVLNGDHGSATWYRPPEASQLLKDDDTHSSHSHLNGGNPQHHTSLDLDSILSIIPNHAQNGHHYHENGFDTLTSLNNNDLMKSEYTYDDSGYATKDSTNGISHIIDSPIMDTDTNFNNNNNDWKQNNNNNNNDTSADSLLRNALQGKSFLSRYTPKSNGVKDGHTELRRALNAPAAAAKSPMDQSPVFIHADDDMDMKHSPLLVLDQSTVIYEEVPVIGIADSDNPSSAHSMDDILLSQLDAASYPEDYEKLKRIANEVAESVNWNLDPTGSPQPHIYINAHVSNDMVMPSSSPIPVPPKSKKYNRNKANSTKAVQQPAHSNGVRKERSLHHCSICSKGFKDKYSVNVHIRTHTGEKPFACSLCGKSFRQKAHLAKHYQTHIAQKNAAAAGGGNGANGTTKSGSKRFASAKAAA